VLKEIEGFDKNVLTEDIEIAWRILRKNYKIQMCLSAKVSTVVPEKFKVWWRQRLRWDIGGIQTLYKHRKEFFRARKSMLGAFVAPFFTVSMIVALIGFFVFVYLTLRRLYSYILLTFFSYKTSSVALQIKSIHLTPTIFTLFGILLLITYISYITLGLKMMDKKKIPFNKKINIVLYMLIYLPLFPILLIHSFILMITGRIIKW
jgi:biofilm PGA synthesis N-glycosyltransferase PgaC